MSKPYAGARPLASYPEPIVRLACKKCDRRGQYRKAVLVARYGADAALPSVLADIASCERATTFQGCGAYFVDLVPKD